MAGVQQRTWVLTALIIPWLAGCVTVAEHRKLERRIWELEQGSGTAAPGERERLAELAARLDDLESGMGRLSGRVEVAEHQADEALSEARAARTAAAMPASAPRPPDSLPGGAGDGASAEEVRSYREAWTAWSEGKTDLCIDRFRDFLQTYASSTYAENASYWMADCYFKRGDFKTAILRFDDVVARYPGGSRAPDALYRQGEALLRAGYGQAAGKAFERVVAEYPESARASEAKKQLQLLGAS